MKIAAGVLLIIAALINLFAAMGYGIFGGAVSAVSGAANEMANQAGGAGDAQSTINTARAAGGGLMVYSIFLLVSVGVMITGAVFAFMDKRANWVLAAGVLALLAEGIGIYILSFGVMNVLGLVAGILAIVASRSIGQSVPQAA